MWLWLLTCIAIERAAFAAVPELERTEDQGAPTELGAAPREEAAILWSEAQALIRTDREHNAIAPLKRLIARHPGSSHYLEAQRLLGEVYLNSGKATEALAPIRYFIEGTKKKMPEAVQGRILLGQAYLRLKRFPELLLLAVETEKLCKGPKTAEPSLLSEASLLKAKALHELHRDPEATLALDAAFKTIADLPAAPAKLKGALALQRLEIKLTDCAQLPSGRKLLEEQVRSQMLRRGNCLLESLLLHEQVSAAQDQPSLDLADRMATQAWLAYLKAAAHPPLPPPLKPVDRTGRELKKYFDELAQSLGREARQKLGEAAQLLEGKAGQSLLHRSLKDLDRSERTTS